MECASEDQHLGSLDNTTFVAKFSTVRNKPDCDLYYLVASFFASMYSCMWGKQVTCEQRNVTFSIVSFHHISAKNI